MIIVDFSHLFTRNLFVAISQTKPRKSEGVYITKEYETYFKHLIFNSLQHIKNKFSGEVILATDSRNNWRKDFYVDYKGTRAKSKNKDINWEEIYALVQNVLEAIKNNFPFRVLEVEKAEADDIAGVLVKHYHKHKNIILVTSDHDWKQNLIYDNVKVYDPIKLEFQELSDYEKEKIETPCGKISRFTAHHTLTGDQGDNVPNVTFKTQFSEKFIDYLKENNIETTDVKTVSNFSNFQELVEKFDEYAITTRGHRKGLPIIDYRVYYKLENSGEIVTKIEYERKNMTENFEEVEKYIKDIYKRRPFGEVKANKILENDLTLTEFLSSDPMYLENFIFSNTLVDFSKIPDDIQKKIIEAYKNSKVNYNPQGILNYFMNENLGQQINQVSKFYSSDHNITNTSSLDDFF